MRIFILMVGLSALFAAAPAWKAHARAGVYWQYHRTTTTTTSKSCPNGYRWDKNVSKCRRGG
jgi:hypothetical protein